jgi:hypothetical protein
MGIATTDFRELGKLTAFFVEGKKELLTCFDIIFQEVIGNTIKSRMASSEILYSLMLVSHGPAEICLRIGLRRLLHHGHHLFQWI